MLAFAPLLVGLFALSPPGPSPESDLGPGASAEAGQQQRFRSLLLASEGLDPELLDAALGLRLPDLELLREWKLDQDSVAALGRYAFLPKPFAAADLRRHVHALLRARKQSVA